MLGNLTSIHPTELEIADCLADFNAVQRMGEGSAIEVKVAKSENVCQLTPQESGHLFHSDKNLDIFFSIVLESSPFQP